MRIRSHYRVRGIQFPFAVAGMIYLVAAAATPALHFQGLVRGPGADVSVPFESDRDASSSPLPPVGDHDGLDCFFCQGIAAGALPSSEAAWHELADPGVSSADACAEMRAAGVLATQRARAPPVG